MNHLTPVPSVTLQTAILMQATEFAEQNATFSIHDITRTIRHKVSNGELEIPETEVSGASFRFDIPHDKVKALFEELWKTGMFDARFTLTRKYKDPYFEYTPTLVFNATPPTTSAPVTSPPVATPTAAPVATMPSVSTPQQDVTTRVVQYLSNCKMRNFRPTLKQVQSAIKRGSASTGWSCSDLQVMIQKEGYQIVSDPQFLSASQVVTV